MKVRRNRYVSIWMLTKSDKCSVMLRGWILHHCAVSPFSWCVDVFYEQSAPEADQMESNFMPAEQQTPRAVLSATHQSRSPNKKTPRRVYSFFYYMFCLKYASMNGFRSPSITLSVLPTS